MRSRPPVVKTSDEFVQAVRDIHASRGPGDREFLRNILPPGKKVREVPADQWSSVLEAYWAGPRPASEPQNGIDPATWAGTAEGEFPTRSGLHEAARDLAVAGIPVFPCLPGAKQPACPNGFKDATTDLATIDRWWTENPNYNVAIYPEGAGYLIIDAERDGADDWLALKSEYKIPDTYTTRTPGGGRHYWFAGLGPSRVRIFGKSIDTRGRGGYILVPPSVVGNKSYKIVDDRDLAPLPEALRDALAKAAERHESAVEDLDLPGNIDRARTVLRGYVDRGDVAVAGRGGQTRTYKLGCELRDLAISEDLAGHLIEEIWNPACEPPWDRGDLDFIVHNAYTYAQNEPGAWAVEPGEQVFAGNPVVAELIAESLKAAAKAKSKAQQIKRELLTTCAASITPRNVEWLWKNRLAFGAHTLYAGDPSEGKSTLLLSVAAAVSVGGPWPCGEGNAPLGNVIIFSAEDNAAQTIVPRLMAAGANLNRVHIVDSAKDENGRRTFNIKTDLDLLEQAIEEIGDVLLVIIDPISAYMGDTNTFKNSEVRRALEPFTGMAERHRVALASITHFNKGGKDASKKAMHRFMDSVAFTAAARVAFAVFHEKEDERHHLLLTVKANIGLWPPGLGYRIEGCKVGGNIETSRIVWDKLPIVMSANEALAKEEERSEDRGTALADAIVFLQERLAGGGWVPAKEVEKDAREGYLISAMTLRRARETVGVELKKDGLQGPWLWRLPDLPLAE